MGDCVYVAIGVEGSEEPTVRRIASESWMDPEAVGRRLSEDHFMNTTTGVWFYDTDLLNDPEGVRAALLKALAFVEAEMEKRGPRADQSEP